jgi:hypothetical protein
MMFKLTTARRALALAVAALLGGLAAVAFSVPSTGGAATNTVYQQTVVGSESHSLSPYYEPAFVSHGGVIPLRVDQAHDSPNTYFESVFDVPVGAKITSLTISYAGCVGEAGSYAFGSYSLTANTSALFTLTPPNSGCARTVINKTGAPLTTVTAGRRYVLDWGFVQSVTPGYTDTVLSYVSKFYGATVKYTCTAPCVP